MDIKLTKDNIKKRYKHLFISELTLGCFDVNPMITNKADSVIYFDGENTKIFSDRYNKF